MKLAVMLATLLILGAAAYATGFAANETGLSVVPDTQEVGKTVMVSVNCAGGGIRASGIGYFVLDSATNGYVGGGGRGAYCSGINGPMTVQYYCPVEGTADLQYGADHVYVKCVAVGALNPTPMPTSTPRPIADAALPSDDAIAAPAGNAPGAAAPIGGAGVLRAPSTGDAGLLQP